MSTPWYLMIIGLVICIGLPIMQRVMAPALFGFERGSDGFNAALSTWLILGSLLFTTGLFMRTFGTAGHHGHG